MKFDTIYKRTTKGAIQIWYQETNEEGDAFRSVSGQIEGQKVTSTWKQVKPKNVGRANATTAQEQAVKVIEANYVGRLNGAYMRNIDDIDTAEKIPPAVMLAATYDEAKVEDWAKVWTQPKLDGIRAFLSEGATQSRSNKPIVSCPHILEALKPVFDAFPGIKLDGELYSHKLKADFNKIISLARKSKPTAENLTESAEKIEYWVYDVPSVDGTFSERHAVLRKAAELFPDSIVLVPTLQVFCHDDLDELYQTWTSDGYEGQMVRIDNAKYENKRSKSLLKRKDFKDEEFEVFAIEEGVGNRSAMAGRIVYKLPDGRTFGSGIKGNMDYFRELLRDADLYVGGQGTVKYFEMTPDGIPRFPVTIALHPGGRNL